MSQMLGMIINLLFEAFLGKGGLRLLDAYRTMLFCRFFSYIHFCRYLILHGLYPSLFSIVYNHTAITIGSQTIEPELRSHLYSLMCRYSEWVAQSNDCSALYRSRKLKKAGLTRIKDIDKSQLFSDLGTLDRIESRHPTLLAISYTVV